MARSTSGTPATQALVAHGIAFSVHEYEHDPRARSYGHEAASLLGLDPDAVFKTLLANVDDALVVGVVPVSSRLDLKALAQAHGGRRADMADPALAQRVTGYVVGGISPLGQKRALPTFIDETAILHEIIYVSGGRRGLDVGLTPDDLARATNAEFAAIARRDRP